MEGAETPLAETQQREAQLLAVLPESEEQQGPMQQAGGPLLVVQAALGAALKVAAVREVPMRLLAVERQQGALPPVARILEVPADRQQGALPPAARILVAPQVVVLPQLNRSWSPHPAVPTG
jgi:hypothetical protein